MKNMMHSLLQAGGDSAKRPKPQKTLSTNDKTGIPQEDQARCALLKGKQPA